MQGDALMCQEFFTNLLTVLHYDSEDEAKAGNDCISLVDWPCRSRFIAKHNLG